MSERLARLRLWLTRLLAGLGLADLERRQEMVETLRSLYVMRGVLERRAQMEREPPPLRLGQRIVPGPSVGPWPGPGEQEREITGLGQSGRSGNLRG